MAEKEPDNEITINELLVRIKAWWNYLLSKRIIIILVIVLGAVAGLFYAIKNKPTYIAELNFVLEDQNASGGLGAYSNLASLAGLDLGGNVGGVFSGDNIMELMKARSMVEKTLLTSVERQGKIQTLADFYIDIYDLRKSWSNNSKLSNIHFPPGEERSALKREKDSLLFSFYKRIIRDNLSILKKDKKLSTITVLVKTTNEIFSKEFEETLVKVVSDYYIETKTKKSAENVAILKHQADSVRRALNRAISGAAYSVDVNPNLNPSRQVLRVPSQNKQIDIQVNTATLEQLVPNLEIAQITLRKETPLIQIIDNPVLPLEVESVRKVKAIALGIILSGLLAVTVFSLLFVFKHLQLKYEL